MTAPIPPLGGLPAGFTAPVSAAPSAPSAGGLDLAGAFGRGLDALQSAQTTASDLAVQAATGNLADISQYTVAATKAQVMTEFSSALRTKAIDAFNTVMGLQA